MLMVGKRTSFFSTYSRSAAKSQKSILEPNLPEEIRSYKSFALLLPGELVSNPARNGNGDNWLNLKYPLQIEISATNAHGQHVYRANGYPELVKGMMSILGAAEKCDSKKLAGCVVVTQNGDISAQDILDKTGVSVVGHN